MLFFYQKLIHCMYLGVAIRVNESCSCRVLVGTRPIIGKPIHDPLSLSCLSFKPEHEPFINGSTRHDPLYTKLISCQPVYTTRHNSLYMKNITRHELTRVDTNLTRIICYICVTQIMDRVMGNRLHVTR